jgi:hypothetical protein
VPEPEPSREELLALIEAQARVIEELRAEIVELKRRLGRRPEPGQAARRGRVGAVPDQHAR